MRAIELIFAIASVNGATAAIAEQGDVMSSEEISKWYSLAADITRDADGKVVKVIGDGVLLTFPPARLTDAVAALRTLQQHGSELWGRFDSRCRVQVKAGIGSVIIGAFGPPGQEREDIFGNELNQLFKMPLGDFVMTSALEARLK